MNINENIKRIIKESIQKFLMKEHYGSRSDFYDDCLGSIGPMIDNLICVKMFPTDVTVHHWREQIVLHAGNMLKSTLTTNNTPNARIKCIRSAMDEHFSKAKNSLLNRFVYIANWYANREKHRKIFPYAPVKTCYNNHNSEIMDAVETLIVHIANQDENSIKKFAFEIF